jgi:hypothetical protein
MEEILNSVRVKQVAYRLHGKYRWSLRVQRKREYSREFNYISGGTAYW